MTRSRRLGQYCADIGRDPSTVRRSLLVYPRFVDVWADEVVAEALVERFHGVGFTEFVFYWPAEHQMPVFEHFVEEVMPPQALVSLRGRGRARADGHWSNGVHGGWHERPLAILVAGVPYSSVRMARCTEQQS